MTSQRSAFAAGTDPGSQSSAELEREVRESRADVERTLDAIQDRLSPGQLVDQVAHYLRDNGGEFARNFGDTVKQNPVPVVMVGVGLAWMMLAGPRRDVPLPRAADLTPGEDFGDVVDEDPDYGPEAWSAYEDGPAAWSDPEVDQGHGFGTGVGDAPAGGTGEGLSEAARRASEGVGDAVERTRAGLREAGEGARQAAGDARAKMGRFMQGTRARAGDMGAGVARGARRTGAGVARGAQRTGARVRRYGDQAREGFLETLHRQPLVLGAVGLAIGAAIGAALPPSRREDELMGDTSDHLKQRARAVGREEFAKAKATGGAAYAAAQEEAEQQGLSRDGLEAAAEAARHKVESVADAAAVAAKDEADRQGLGATGGTA